MAFAILSNIISFYVGYSENISVLTCSHLLRFSLCVSVNDRLSDRLLTNAIV